MTFYDAFSKSYLITKLMTRYELTMKRRRCKTFLLLYKTYSNKLEALFNALSYMKPTTVINHY